MFTHEKLKVYQQAITFLQQATQLCSSLPPGNSEFSSQLRRAALSITLNVAEGGGKTGAAEKRRFYAIARGSSLECAAIIDALYVVSLINRRECDHMKMVLEPIVSMLTVLARGKARDEGKEKVKEKV